MSVVKLLDEGGSLADRATDLLGFLQCLRQSPDPGDAGALRTRLNGMLEEFRQGGAAVGIPGEAIEQARYGLIAMIDEMIMTSAWPIKGEWLGKPLQMEHYGNFAAGEEFYTRLATLRADTASPGSLEAIEIYLLCLCLGFRGKHGTVAGIEVVAQLQKELLALLDSAARPASPQQTVAVSARDEALGRSRRKSDPSDLSPAWRAPDTAGPATKQLPLRPVLVACLVTVFLFYLLLVGLLTGSVGGVLDLASPAAPAVSGKE